MTAAIRILHVFGKLNRGGAESRVMDLYRHMDRTKVQFDFLVHYDGTDMSQRPKEDLDDEVLSLGGRIYVLPRFTGKNYGEYKKACRDFFAEHHDFAAVEGHMTSTASIYLPIAKAAGVPVTMAHARSAGVDGGLKGLATKLLRRSLSRRCDIMLSCSKVASIAVYGRKAYESGQVRFVPNALELRPFAYQEARRNAVRVMYGIPEDAIVIGHVGRLDPVKNHTYIASIGAALEQLQAGDPGKKRKWYYLFAGKGALQEEIQRAFESAGIADHLIFTGQLPREQTAAIYQAFDVFVFPSLYEGLPGTVLEAQAAGLPCVIASTISDEVELTDLVKRLPIGEKDAEIWAKEILRRTTGSEPGCVKAGDRAGRKAASEKAQKALDEAGYNVETAAKKMQEFYLML